MSVSVPATQREGEHTGIASRAEYSERQRRQYMLKRRLSSRASVGVRVSSAVEWGEQ